MASLKEEHEMSMAAAKKENEAQTSSVSEEKDTEMISLRSRLEEMEKSLDAKTAEAIQLEKEAAQKREEDRERFEGTMASLKEEHEMSMAAVKKEYEAQTSSVSEEKDTEMISLRSRLEEMEKSLDAKTAEAIQLEKEAAQKLEEDRERFEGTMASLKEE